jgi:hypothetical protein
LYAPAAGAYDDEDDCCSLIGAIDDEEDVEDVEEGEDEDDDDGAEAHPAGSLTFVGSLDPGVV